MFDMAQGLLSMNAWHDALAVLRKEQPGRREDSLAALLKTLSRSPSRRTWNQQTSESSAATGFAPQANTTELARSSMVLGNIYIIDRKYDAAEAYIDRAVPVLRAIAGYHKVRM